MFPLNEVDEVRRIQLGVLAEIEHLARHRGSYKYVVYVGGALALSHKLVGRVIRELS